MSRTLSTYPITYLNGTGTGKVPFRGAGAAPGLGLVATGRRKINKSNRFDAYYPIRQLKEVPLGTGDSYMTLDKMVQKIKADHQEAAKITKKLYSPDLGRFTRNIFDHIYQNFQYKVDPQNREQVKGVAGSYAKRMEGIDCDDMAFLAGAILFNAGTPFAIRKIATAATGDFSHVYIVVPKKPGLSLSVRSHYYVIDPVIDTYDFEYPHDKRPKYYDEVMVNPKKSTMNGMNDCTLQGIESYDLNSKDGWEALRASILTGDEPVPDGETYDAFLYKVNLILNAWDDPEVREATIEALIEEEEESMAMNGMAGRGWLKRAIRKTGRGIGKAAKSVGRAAKKVTKGAVRVAKKVATVFPATLLAREGIKVWFKVAGRKKAAALWPGLYTREQARSVGISDRDWRIRNNKWKKVAKVFENIGGRDEKLAEAIHDGGKKISGKQKWWLDSKTVIQKRPVKSSSTSTSTIPRRRSGTSTASRRPSSTSTRRSRTSSRSRRPSTTTRRSGTSTTSRRPSTTTRKSSTSTASRRSSTSTTIPKRPSTTSRRSGTSTIPRRPSPGRKWTPMLKSRRLKKLRGMDGLGEPITAGAATAAAAPFIVVIVNILKNLSDDPKIVGSVKNLVDNDKKTKAKISDLIPSLPDSLKKEVSSLVSSGKKVSSLFDNVKSAVSNAVQPGKNMTPRVDPPRLPSPVRKLPTPRLPSPVRKLSPPRLPSPVRRLPLEIRQAIQSTELLKPAPAPPEVEIIAPSPAPAKDNTTKYLIGGGILAATAIAYMATRKNGMNGVDGVPKPVKKGVKATGKKKKTLTI